MPDDPVLLERHFDTAFAAPNGIQKLRELILTLAMQGKLVPQDPSDQPAIELLKEIEVEKQRLVKEGKVKQPKPLPEIKPGEIPYKLPINWEWVRLGELGEAQTGTTPPTKDAENLGSFIPFIGPGDIKNHAIDYSGEGLSEIGLSKGRLIEKNSVLMVCIGGSIGKHAINDRNITCNQQINTITPYKREAIKYMFFAMGEESFQQIVLGQSGGSATPIINKQKWSSIPVPLPPLAEQHRIVAKIDRLMARCDELEKLRAERNQKRITVHTAALDRLLNVKESNDFSTAWRFITQHFGELYSVKENVAELRKAILQLAVMGKLVPQDPTDEPASELLRAIANGKQQLVKEGKIKKTKIVTPIEQSNVPFPLPDAWIWAPTEALCDIIVDCPHSTPIFTASGCVCLDTNVFKNGALIPHKIRYVSEETYLERIQRLVPQAGDVVFAREGSVGESVIIPEGMNCCLGQRVMLFRLARYVLPTYFRLALSERSSLSRLLDLHKGIGAKHVNVLDMRNALIPLPPLAEQHRIVAKINQLMALCDHLDQQIDAATGKQSALLSAVMAQV